MDYQAVNCLRPKIRTGALNPGRKVGAKRCGGAGCDGDIRPDVHGKDGKLRISTPGISWAMEDSSGNKDFHFKGVSMATDIYTLLCWASAWDKNLTSTLALMAGSGREMARNSLLFLPV